MKYISELIGDAYRNWKPRDEILITSPTGSGKSYFILHTLLPYALGQGKHIVYFCNRKILCEQLQGDAEKVLKNVFGFDFSFSEDEIEKIHIVTYQYCEAIGDGADITLSNPELKDKSKEETQKLIYFHHVPRTVQLSPPDILYYIFDEAHYFLSDSLFNRNTYSWLKRNFYEGISIFLTATPEPLILFLEAKKPGVRSDLSSLMRDSLDKLLEWDEIKEKLSKPSRSLSYVSETPHNSLKLKFNPKSEYQEQYRKINPLGGIGDFIQKTLMSPKPCFDFKYEFPPNYEYINTVYFNEYSDLIDEIKSSEDAWLVFVNEKSDGAQLSTHLASKGITTALLTSDTRSKENCDGYHEFESIVTQRKFKSKVLIATTVMDCGVSISDPKLKNIVIGHTEKTEFLQMLGRRRVRDNEKITLYIKSFSWDIINQFRASSYGNLLKCIEFENRNRTKYVPRLSPTADWDGMIEVSVIGPEKRFRKIVENLDTNFVSPTQQLYNALKHREWPKQMPSYVNIFEEYEINLLAFLFSAYNYRNYEDALTEHRDQRIKFYLERQLSWIGKKYDIHNWLNYDKIISDFISYLKEKVNRDMFKSEQEIFRKECSEFISSLPASPGKREYNYNEQHLPGKKVLNDIFKENFVPFEIKSRQTSCKGERKSVWILIETGI